MTNRPSKIALRDWTHFSRTILVRPGESLRNAIEDAVALEPAPAHGYFCVEPAFSAAVFVDDGRLKLQVASQVFDWERESVTVAHRHVGLNECRSAVWVNGQEILQLTYQSVASMAIEAGDMTVDAIDEETQDWWLWLSRISCETRFRLNIVDLLIRGIR